MHRSDGSDLSFWRKICGVLWVEYKLARTLVGVIVIFTVTWFVFMFLWYSFKLITLTVNHKNIDNFKRCRVQILSAHCIFDRWHNITVPRFFMFIILQDLKQSNLYKNYCHITSVCQLSSLETRNQFQQHFKSDPCVKGSRVDKIKGHVLHQ